MGRLVQILMLSAVALLMLVGCATVGPPRPPSLDLPKPPSDLRASRKGDRVLLSWTIPTTTTDRETIRILGPTQICRDEAELTACGTPVGQVSTPVAKPEISKHKAQSSYTDQLPSRLESDSPTAFISYAVQVLNPEGRSAGLSNEVRVPLIHTLPPPSQFQARVSKEGIIISWKGDSVPEGAAMTQYTYRIYRRSEGSQQAALAGEAFAGQPEYTYTDNTIEWQKTYFYHAESVTLIRQRDNPQLVVEGDETAELKVFADDVFPPAVPSELQAVFSGPGQKAFIDLVWAPVSDVDLAGYNVYRREGDGGETKLNTELVKTPAYRDEAVSAQKQFLYSVSAVDIHGNESARSEEAHEVVP
jgi:hypothetical protein